MKFEQDLFLNKKGFPVSFYYLIENNLSDFNQKLNLFIPTNTLDVEHEHYLNTLTGYATNHKNKAYRSIYSPPIETFFSSKENRIRLETIFLDKGIEIISRIREESKQKNHRPLGKTYQVIILLVQERCFLLGEISVIHVPSFLWWDVPSHNWKPLFKVHKRGIN
ncbi:MAG: hypothetical protein IPO04_09925 [Cytophagaceae bacterium]|nr:hypothetical protein [Cytophagaceae bacterium]